jgi:hypothetical protein
MPPELRSDAAARLAPVLSAFARGDLRAAARALLDVAAPRLAARLGDEDHLAHVLGNPAWAPLVGHRSAEVGPEERIGDAARLRIEVRSARGEPAAYLASARRDAGGAWQVTGLVREELASG